MSSASAPSSSTTVYTHRNPPPLSSKSNLKRKNSSSGDLKISLASLTDSTAGPVLANFPAVDAPQSTQFQLYRSKEFKAGQPIHDQKTVLAGETRAIEFSASNRESILPTDGEGSSSFGYVIGQYDPKTKSLILAPAPNYLLKHSVKRLKTLESIQTDLDANRMEARNKLGEAFGTKKSKTRIKTRERNVVDAAGMESVRGFLEGKVESSGISMPTKAEVESSSLEALPIPKPNMAATKPSEAYSLVDIIPEHVSNSLTEVLKSIKSAAAEERDAFLPWRHSQWIKKRYHSIWSAPKVNNNRLKMVYYISCIRMFMKLSNKLGDLAFVQEKMGSAPPAVVQNLIKMFTETTRGSSAPQTTSFTDAKLHLHMLCLALMVDNFACDSNELAKDLSVPVTKINNYFKALGCKIEIPSPEERERLGISLKEANAAKKALLKIPLEFPKASRGAPKK